MSHLLWNLYTRIKNGQAVGKVKILQRRTKLCGQFLNILWKEGYINSFCVSKKNLSMFEINLKYQNGKPAINNIIAISKPSKRVYIKAKDLWKVNKGLRMLILSTNKGLITDKKCKELRIGGELFCVID